jgi:geranylgeranyl diphosphate synthase type II
MDAIAWHFPPRLVEESLDKVLCEPSSSTHSHSELARLREAMRYAVFSGGKRFRSQLMMESAAVVAQANGQRPDAAKVLPAASALEMIHAYSLVHDDLPAMDDADTRRGRPSCHKAYGEANAILVGDALLTSAFEILMTPADGNDAQSTLRAARLIAQAAGEAGMVGGQTIDIAWSHEHINGVTAEELLQMHAMKTGALIRCASEVGAVLAGGSDEQITALHNYGKHLGRAFQIHDDVLDVEGDPALTGKAASDAANNKTTAPAIFGLEAAKQMARESGQLAIDALNIFDKEADALRQLARFVTEREK